MSVDMARVMRHDRTVVEVDANFMTQFGDTLGFKQAADETWLPVCDVKQYERGERPERVANDGIGVSVEFTVVDSDAPEKVIRAIGKIHEGIAEICGSLSGSPVAVPKPVDQTDYLLELQGASKPLMEFIEKHHDPHTKAVIDSHRVEVVSGIANQLRKGFQFVESQPSRTA